MPEKTQMVSSNFGIQKGDEEGTQEDLIKFTAQIFRFVCDFGFRICAEAQALCLSGSL
jgi:hypothetical protein